MRTGEAQGTWWDGGGGCGVDYDFNSTSGEQRGAEGWCGWGGRSYFVTTHVCEVEKLETKTGLCHRCVRS